VIGVTPVRSEVSHDQLTQAGVVMLKVVHEPSRRHAPVSTHDLEAELQMTLAILSDLDCAYERLRNRVDSWSGPIKRREHLRVQLERFHRRDREKWCARLAHLHNRITDLMTFPRLGP
jgi:hypothetical protein